MTEKVPPPVDGQDEGAQNLGRVTSSLTPTTPGGQVQECGAELGENRLAEGGLIMFGGLQLDDLPSDPLRQFGELVEQNGLADTAKTRDDHGLLSASPLEAFEQHREGLGLSVTPDESLGGRSRIGCVRVVDVVHGTRLEVLSRFIHTQ